MSFNSSMQILWGRKFHVLIFLGACLVHQASAEEKIDKADVSMAATLIGSISFIMVLYYFTNYNDKDIQAASWETISSTISIFCAVLLFQSFNDLTEAYIIDPNFGKEEASVGALFVDMVHMIFWYSMLQILLAHLSGALSEDALEELGRRDAIDKTNNLSKKKKEMELNVKCFAVLMAHITGFASINAWGTVQQFPFFKQSPGHAMMAVVCGITGQLLLQRITDTIRERIALSDDGMKSEYEEAWDEQCEDAENDVMALTISFLTVNSLRFVISGCLPNQEGAEEECHVDEYLYHHTRSQKALLLGAGLVFTVCIFIVVFNYPESWLEEEEEESDDEEEEETNDEEEGGEAHAEAEEGNEDSPLLKRFAAAVVVSLSMCFSWAFFYGNQMVLAGISVLEGKSELLSIVLALTVSLLGFTLLILFDALADADSSIILAKWDAIVRKPSVDSRRPSLVKRGETFDRKVDSGIRQIMSAVGFAIGFSWEQCFDKSVDAIAVSSNNTGVDGINQHSMKLFLSIFCSLLLVPAWRWYMLPFVTSKGWRFGYLANLSDIYHDHPEKKQLIEKAKSLKRLIMAAEKKTEEGQDEKREQENGNDYAVLASNDTDALKKEVSELRSQNREMSRQLQEYQAIFDSHLDGHLEMLKKMSAAVHGLEPFKR